MEPPIKPDPSDCCNSGCIPCILDVYEDQLKKYENNLKTKNCTKSFKNCLSLTSFSIFILKEVQRHTKDTYFFTFKYLKSNREQEHKQTDGIFYRPGQHVLIKAFDNSDFTRAYTLLPIASDNKFEFKILVRLYKNGKMSNILKTLQPGSETLWRGPYGEYKSDYSKKHMLLIAQGTGVAPLYAIAKDMVENEECYTFLRLLFCCDSDNILLRTEILTLSEYWNFNCELFVSNKINDNFVQKYNEVVHFDRLKKTYIEEYFLGKNINECKVLICGSDSFSKVMNNYILECELINTNVFIF